MIKQRLVILAIFMGAGLGWYLAWGTDTAYSDVMPDYPAMAMVARGIDAYREKGDKVFYVVNDADGPYRDGNLYLFVIRQSDHYQIASAGHPDRTGPLDAFSGQEKALIVGIVAQAGPDGSWVTYDYDNPETGRVEPKRSWIMLYDGYVFGAGLYGGMPE